MKHASLGSGSTSRRQSAGEVMASMRMQLVMIVVATLLAGPSWGAVFSCDEAGLDAAIAAAGGGDPGPHTFDCAGPTVIPVTSDKFVFADITIDGGGLVTLDGGNTTRWLARNFGSQQELRDLNVIGLGFESKAALTLRRVHLTGIDPPGRFGIDPVVLLDSDLYGTFSGTLNLIESSIQDNNTCAIWGPSGKAVIDRSTISGNSGELCGGVKVFFVEILNSTISGNTHLGDCQGASGVDAASVLISHSTIVGNAGVFDEADLSYGLTELFRIPRERGQPPPDPPFICVIRAGEPVIVENSIIGSCVNSAGVVAPSGGGNVESPGNTCLFNHQTDQVNVSALDLDLDVLADNGGATETHALLPRSAAIDAGIPNCPPPSTDQRGVPRPQGAGCDAGAYEAVLEVAIDIKPGSDPNSINPSLEGDVPVAILGSDSFDVAGVDVTTLAFGPGGAAFDHSQGPHYEDLDGDGFTDLMSHFRIEKTGIEFGDMKACITGETLDGTLFRGCDAVRTVPDMDGDGLLDTEEAAIGTNALNPDTDGDGFTDGQEVLVMGTDPLDPLDPTPDPVPERRRKRMRRR